MDVDVEPQPGGRLAAAGSRLDLAHVRGPRERQQARAPLERVAQLRGIHLAALQQPREDPRIDVAGARRHDQPGERREPHRRVHRAAVEHGGERCPRAEVAGDDAPRALDELRGPPRCVGVREAVEAVPAQSVPLAPLGRERVRVRRLRQGRVERRVEARDRGEVGAGATDRLERVEGGRLVQGGELGERAQVGQEGVVHDHGRRVVGPAVDDPVPGGRPPRPPRPGRPRARPSRRRGRASTRPRRPGRAAGASCCSNPRSRRGRCII